MNEWVVGICPFTEDGWMEVVWHWLRNFDSFALRMYDWCGCSIAEVPLGKVAENATFFSRPTLCSCMLMGSVCFSLL